MCDRKKPCGRCVQLGITGLCVYEVDNPSHRADSEDDGSRLRQRVAELEGVIRQMKNKPHPRWVRSAASAELDGNDKPQSSCSESSSSGLSDRLSSEPGEGASTTAALILPLQPSFSVMPPSGTQSPVAHTSGCPTSPSGYYNTPSSFGSSSPLATPPDELQLSFPGVASDHTFTPDFDFTSMFMGYANLLSPYEEGLQTTTLHQQTECISAQRPGGEHCGCLTEHSSHQAVLELSIRLRKAADSLRRSTHHHLESNCKLNQQIAELDAYAASALANAQYPSETSPMPSSPSSRPTSSYSGAAPAFAPHHRSSFSDPLNSGQPHSAPHSAGSPLSIQSTIQNYNDNFMAWRGPAT